MVVFLRGIKGRVIPVQRPINLYVNPYARAENRWSKSQRSRKYNLGPSLPPPTQNRIPTLLQKRPLQAFRKLSAISVPLRRMQELLAYFFVRTLGLCVIMKYQCVLSMEVR